MRLDFYDLYNTKIYPRPTLKLRNIFKQINISTTLPVNI